MEGRDRAVVTDPDVSSVRVVTEGFGGKGDRSRNVRQKRGEFAVQVVIFYNGKQDSMFRFFNFNCMSQKEGGGGTAYGIGHI